MPRKILFAFAILLGSTCKAQDCAGASIIDPTFITEGGTYNAGNGNYVVCTSESATFTNPDSVWGDYGTNITVIDPVNSYIFSNGYVHVIGAEGAFSWDCVALVIAEEDILIDGPVNSIVQWCPDGIYMEYDGTPLSELCSAATGLNAHDPRKGPVVGPNPVSDRLSILGGGAILGSRLTDLQGREVLRAGANTKELDVSSLAPGQYVLSVQTPEGTVAGAVVKE